ncbi:unnamed protein product [Calypogeia fissa]
MEIQSMNSLRHHAPCSLKSRHGALLDGSLSLLRGKAPLLPLKAPSRGGVRASSCSSFGSCSSCGKAYNVSTWSSRSRINLGKSGERRRWARGVMSPPFTEHAIGDKGEEEKGLEESSLEASSGQSFDWKSNWYPVIPEQDLDRAVPHPFQLLGRKMVIWYDRNSAEWKAFADVCPHRLAPLSEGRIDEKGCLQCCYHGWSFDGDGACTRIPQAQNEGPEAKAATKTGVPTFPSTVKQGILFIWPDENGQEKAQKTNPPITPEHDLEGFSTVPTFRDMDYGWDTGMENLLDPSHLPVAHHKVNGGTFVTRDMAKPILIDMNPLTPKGTTAKWGFIGSPMQDLIFDAPSRNTYLFSLNGQVMGTTTTYVTPTAPGRCRVIIENGKRHWLAKLKSSGPEWWQLTPRWLDHQKMLNLLDGDESLLHFQERILRETTNGQVENWSKVFYMPTTADRFVGAFRQWISRFGGNGVMWADGVDPTLPPLIEKKEDLLDRYNSHTKQCAICSKALANFKLARTALFIAAVLLVGGAPLLNDWKQRIQLVVAAGISALIAWRVQVEWIPMFYYKGYDHARIP